MKKRCLAIVGSVALGLMMLAGCGSKSSSSAVSYTHIDVYKRQGWLSREDILNKNPESAPAEYKKSPASSSAGMGAVYLYRRRSRR